MCVNEHHKTKRASCFLLLLMKVHPSMGGETASHEPTRRPRAPSPHAHGTQGQVGVLA